MSCPVPRHRRSSASRWRWGNGRSRRGSSWLLWRATRVSPSAWRCESCGGLGLATTDLVNARSILEKRPRSFELAETCAQDRPLAIQIYGHVTSEMESAARWVVDQGASAVDINMGCPVNKVVKTGGGSALMCQTESAVALVEAVVQAVDAPVTVKMRLGWDAETLTAPALAREFEKVGVAAVIIHGRTREQGFTGRVNRAGHSRGGRGRRADAGRRQRRHPHAGRRRRDVPRDRLRGRLDRGGRCRTPSSSDNSRIGPNTATPAPSRRSRNAWT